MIVYLLLGSNKGDRLKYLMLAEYLISKEAGKITQKSAVYVTQPWEKLNQPNYLNQAIELETDKSPLQLLKILQKIEKSLGRTNKGNYAARTIDIDILLYDAIIFNSKNLIIPHPRMHLRNFTLQPLLTLNKTYTHPILHASIEELAKICKDDLKVSIFEKK